MNSRHHELSTIPCIHFGHNRSHMAIESIKPDKQLLWYQLVTKSFYKSDKCFNFSFREFRNETGRIKDTRTDLLWLVSATV